MPPQTAAVGEDRRKKQHRQLLQRLGSQLGRLAQQQQQHHYIKEREKILCDYILHHQFFLGLLKQYKPHEQQQQQPGQQQKQLCRPPEARHLPYTYDLPHSCGICGQFSPASVQQQQQLPDTFVAHLVRGATAQDVRQVLHMTAEDWLAYFSEMLPQLAYLLEAVERADALACVRSNTTISTILAAAASQHAATGDTLCFADTPPSSDGSISSDCSTFTMDTDAAGAAAAAAAALSVSSSSLLGSMFPHAVPRGLCPAVDLHELLRLQGRTCLLLMLACGLNHIPLFKAGATCYSPGREVTDKPAHWQRVVDSIHLSETQELHLSIIVAEYKRVSARLEAEGRLLLQQAATPSLHLAAAATAAGAGAHKDSPAQPGGSPQSGARGDTSGSSGATIFRFGQQQQQQQKKKQQPAAPSASRGSEQGEGEGKGASGTDYETQLALLMLRRQAHIFSTSACIVNTLTAYQQAAKIVASFPFIPSLMSVAEIAAARLQERQAQRVRAIEQHTVTFGMANYDVPVAEIAAAALAAGAAGVEQQQQPGGGSGGEGGSAGGGPLTQAVAAQYQQRREAQIELHRSCCWAEIDVLYEQEKQQLLSFAASIAAAEQGSLAATCPMQQ